MTEYEIADLAASRAFEFQGMFSLFQVQIGTVSDGIQQFMSLLFGFLAAAYFIGPSLDRRQTRIFTALYIMWQIWTMAAIVGRGIILTNLGSRVTEMQGAPPQFLAEFPLVLTTSSMILLTIALVASLYFMWDVRHPKTE